MTAPQTLGERVKGLALALGFALAGGARVLAFGPHMDVEKMRAAKDAGVTRTISNSQFHRNMAELIERYALPADAGT